MDLPIIPAAKGKGRKRIADKEMWKKNIEKAKRHTAIKYLLLPTCGHNTNKFACSSLTRRDIQHFNSVFYKTTNKIIQDNLILKYTKTCYPKRKNLVGAGLREKKVTIKYYVKKGLKQPGEKPIVPVCRKTFLGILNVSKFRVNMVCKRHMDTGEPAIENRGGDTRSNKYEDKKRSVKQFIESLTISESHYCRENSKRQYLPSELNISKLWRMYNGSTNPTQKVTHSYFRKIFNTSYNIGFGTAATDACSFCIMKREKLKTATNSMEKSNLMCELRLHKLRAKAFFELLKSHRDKEISLSYDCQKNLVLPKVADQAAYYSRQLYTYNFTICEGTSKSTQTSENVYIYSWLESAGPKGSNEIASAIYNQLKEMNLTNVEKIKLFADGCGGQNKNHIVIFMISYWLRNDAPNNIREVELIFPVVGHSYIPPDRVFGRIEQELKKRSTIIHPNEYLEIFSKYGSVIKLGIDCKIFDWKLMSKNTSKLPASWHFKLNPSKRISIKKSKSSVIIKGETSYRSDVGEYRGILKKGKVILGMQKQERNLQNFHVKLEKLNDVSKLLAKHFGDNWKEMPTLAYYRDVISKYHDNDDTEVEEECEGHWEQDVSI